MAHKRPQPAPIAAQQNKAKKPEDRQKTELELISHRRKVCPKQSHKSQPEIAALLTLILFLILNIGCFSLIDISPERLQATLGAAPQTLYINLAYAIFVITEIILLLCRLTRKHVPHHAWRKLGFLVGFYSFFWISGAMPENFLLLLATGTGLLLSEYFRLLRLTVKAVGAEIQTESEF